MKHDARFQYIEVNAGELFNQYVALRRSVFLRHYPGLSKDFGLPEEADRASRIVLALCEDRVVGGARLTISSPGRPCRLPMEDCGFELSGSSVYKDLALRQTTYGEVSRMAVAPDCAQNLEVSFGIAQKLCQVAGREETDLLFSICPDGAARINRINSRRCGVHFRTYWKVPTIFGIEMWLCVFSGIRERFGNPVEALCAR